MSSSPPLIGRTVYVPPSVWPQEKPPAEGFWQGRVTGTRKPSSNQGDAQFTVVFPGDKQVYWFPGKPISQWLTKPSMKATKAAAISAPAKPKPKPLAKPQTKPKAGTKPGFAGPSKPAIPPKRVAEEPATMQPSPQKRPKGPPSHGKKSAEEEEERTSPKKPFSPNRHVPASASTGRPVVPASPGRADLIRRINSKLATLSKKMLQQVDHLVHDMHEST